MTATPEIPVAPTLLGVVSVAEIIAARKRPKLTHRYYSDPELAEAHSAAKAALEDAVLISPELTAAVAKTRSALEPTVFNLCFEAMPRADFDDLIDLYPPTAAQAARAKSLGGSATVDVRNLPKHLLAACATGPTMTPDSAEALLNGMRSGDASELFWSIMNLNSARTVDALGKD